MNYGLYFTILTVLWLSIWAGAAWYFETRRARGPLFRRLSIKRRLLLVACLVAISCVYCLSYAPYKRVLAAAPNARPTLGALDDLYVPVQWLFDHTPLQTPLLRWAELCNASPDRLIAESHSRSGSHFWGTTPPVLYAAGWIFLGIVWCLLPPYLFYRGMVWWRERRKGISLHAQNAT
jgi:hypothetical protein